MKEIVAFIAEYVRQNVRASVANLSNAGGELRNVFHGPPMELLAPVFESLARGGGIEAQLADGTQARVPVMLLVDTAGEFTMPAVGESGRCDSTHLVQLRNSPKCPRFVALAAPGGASNLSTDSARTAFGIASRNNSGIATTSDWWNDEFVQFVANAAIIRLSTIAERERSQALMLVEKAVEAADGVDRHTAARTGAWRVLARVWEVQRAASPAGSAVAAACGFPPTESGVLNAKAQDDALVDLADRFIASGFNTTVAQLSEGAEEAERNALAAMVSHLQARCNSAHALERTAPYYYCPLAQPDSSATPSWWTYLTVERLQRLLDSGDDPADDAVVEISCHDPLFISPKGLPVVVKDTVTLTARAVTPDKCPPTIEIVRDMPGGNRAAWKLALGGDETVVDPAVPGHRAPVRYVVEGAGLKRTNARIISLASFAPGAVLNSRTATKVSAPKKVTAKRGEDIAYEISATLSGQGRHYFDIYVAPDRTVGPFVLGSNDDGSLDEAPAGRVLRVNEGLYGFEVQVDGDRYFQFEVNHPEVGPEKFRVYVDADETEAEACSSEFERLIKANRFRAGKGSTDVHVDRQHRHAVLQGWALAKEQAESSYYPYVLAPDYDRAWRQRDWTSTDVRETIYSLGSFLNDPRPPRSSMAPPQAFLDSRRSILARIRGDDDGGLIEAARLGEWMATDSDFATLVETYVASYDEWLGASPEQALWCDLGIVCGLEADGKTLSQDPDALLVSPFHPVRLAWHCLAQRTLYLAQRSRPCPAASVLDPDAVPDSLTLPLRTPDGATKQQVFISVECSSDYWSILWNASRLDRLPTLAHRSPFDKELGILIGGVSSGFSVSQVRRSLNDIGEIFCAKPVLSIGVSSASGFTTACNEGLIAWSRERFGRDSASDGMLSMGPRFLRIVDERPEYARPEDAEISNLAEDTANTVQWLVGRPDATPGPDLAIIAQLDVANPGSLATSACAYLGPGGLLRHRSRHQLPSGDRAFLVEARSAVPRPPSGDGLADLTAAALVRLENGGPARTGYAFAPSVHAIRDNLARADFAAVSSAAVDPACFLGGWLDDAYLWDYELPSYSHRSGDSNGYYLLSRIKQNDREALSSVLSKLPACDDLDDPFLEQIILEVARRGFPTVRGLSRGDSGASGDLGVFIASRLLQDEFRTVDSPGSLLSVRSKFAHGSELALLIPVDPFRGYIEDLTKALSIRTFQRPDFVVACVNLTESKLTCRLTPIEVKYRGGTATMSPSACTDALGQAAAFSSFLGKLLAEGVQPEQLMWKLAFQHLVGSMIGFGLRVYSQHKSIAGHHEEWNVVQARLTEGIFSEEIEWQLDPVGRLVVVDATTSSGPRDHDGDGFFESMIISKADAASIVKGDSAAFFGNVRERLGTWRFRPTVQEEPALVMPAAPTAQPLVAPSAPVASALPEESPGVVPESIPTTTVIASSSIPAAEPPARGVRIVVGDTVDDFVPARRELSLSNTDLTQMNIGVVGDLGTGKTQFLKSLIYQTVRSQQANRGVKPRFLIFDYKKDYLSEDFVAAVGAKVVKPYRLPINLFDTRGAEESMTPWLDRFRFFADVLNKIYNCVGPVQRHNLKSAVKQSYDLVGSGQSPTIYDVYKSYETIVAGRPDTVLSTLGDLVDMELFSPGPLDPDATSKFLDGVVVVSLGALGQDDQSKNMLVAIMLNVFYEQMLRIPKRPFEGTDPQLRVIDSFLLVDEADNIMRYEFDVLRKVLLQGREFGVGVVLASQYLRHFKAGGTDYREPLLSWFIHKVPNITPAELVSLGFPGSPAQIADRIRTLEKHQCVYKSFDCPGEVILGMPFYKLMQ